MLWMIPSQEHVEGSIRFEYQCMLGAAITRGAGVIKEMTIVYAIQGAVESCAVATAPLVTKGIALFLKPGCLP